LPAITDPTTVALDTSGSPCFTALAGPDQILSCGGETVNLTATSGTTGFWSIISSPPVGEEKYFQIVQVLALAFIALMLVITC
jgi:hypothetical protein